MNSKRNIKFSSVNFLLFFINVLFYILTFILYSIELINITAFESILIAYSFIGTFTFIEVFYRQLRNNLTFIFWILVGFVQFLTNCFKYNLGFPHEIFRILNSLNSLLLLLIIFYFYREIFKRLMKCDLMLNLKFSENDNLKDKRKYTWQDSLFTILIFATFLIAYIINLNDFQII